MRKIIIIVSLLVLILSGFVLASLITQPWLWSFWGPSMNPNVYVAELAGNIFTAQVWNPSTPKYPGDLVTYDKPLVTTFDGTDFNQVAFGGYWVRHSNKWVQFSFSGILPTKAKRIYVDLYLDVTNRLNGEGGLDGVVDIEIYKTDKIPGKPKECKGDPKARPNFRIRNVLLENVYTHSKDDVRITGYPRVSNIVGPDPPHLEAHHTQATIDFPASLLKCALDPNTGQVRCAVTIRVVRHNDSATVNTPVLNDRYVPILMRRTPAGLIDFVAPDVYENNDPKTVHLGVQTEEVEPDITKCPDVPPGVVPFEPKFAEIGTIVLKDEGPLKIKPTTTTTTTIRETTTTITTSTTTTTIRELCHFEPGLGCIGGCGGEPLECVQTGPEQCDCRPISGCHFDPTGQCVGSCADPAQNCQPIQQFGQLVCDCGPS